MSNGHLQLQCCVLLQALPGQQYCVLDAAAVVPRCSARAELGTMQASDVAQELLARLFIPHAATPGRDPRLPLFPVFLAGAATMKPDPAGSKEYFAKI